eukprot:21408-Prymnesium_polylepis.1
MRRHEAEVNTAIGAAVIGATAGAPQSRNEPSVSAGHHTCPIKADQAAFSNVKLILLRHWNALSEALCLRPRLAVLTPSDTTDHGTTGEPQQHRPRGPRAYSACGTGRQRITRRFAPTKWSGT